MRRVTALTSYLLRDLIRSLSAIAPLAAGLAFGVIAFEYGMDQPQLITVGGVGFGFICVLTTLLLAGRAGRMAFYPLVARLPSRAQLLASLMLAAVGLTGGLAVVIAGANQLGGRLTLHWPTAIWIVPTWLALWLFAAALALPLTSLTGRAGSHLVSWLIVVGVLVANDRKDWLVERGLQTGARVVEWAVWPVATLLARASSGVHDRTYFLALGLTLALGALLFALASALFRRKDLVWTE